MKKNQFLNSERGTYDLFDVDVALAGIEDYFAHGQNSAIITPELKTQWYNTIRDVEYAINKGDPNNELAELMFLPPGRVLEKVEELRYFLAHQEVWGVA